MKICGYEIRNLIRIPSQAHFEGHSFTFEAKRGDEWIPYGPDVCGNWTVASGLSHRLPSYCPPGYPEDVDTIRIGWHNLDAAYQKELH